MFSKCRFRIFSRGGVVFFARGAHSSCAEGGAIAKLDLVARPISKRKFRVLNRGASPFFARGAHRICAGGGAIAELDLVARPISVQ